MNFIESLKILGIEEFNERIINSNSRGELFHLVDYFFLADSFVDDKWFADWFKETVRLAEEQWDRPESVFQHIPRLLVNTLQRINKK